MKNSQGDISSLQNKIKALKEENEKIKKDLDNEKKKHKEDIENLQNQLKSCLIKSTKGTRVVTFEIFKVFCNNIKRNLKYSSRFISSLNISVFNISVSPTKYPFIKLKKELKLVFIKFFVCSFVKEEGK